MTGVVQEVFGKRIYSLSFQNGLYKDIPLNQITIVVVRSEVEEEIGVREVDMIPEVQDELGLTTYTSTTHPGTSSNTSSSK